MIEVMTPALYPDPMAEARVARPPLSAPVSPSVLTDLRRFRDTVKSSFESRGYLTLAASQAQEEDPSDSDGSIEVVGAGLLVASIIAVLIAKARSEGERGENNPESFGGHMPVWQKTTGAGHVGVETPFIAVSRNRMGGMHEGDPDEGFGVGVYTDARHSNGDIFHDDRALKKAGYKAVKVDVPVWVVPANEPACSGMTVKVNQKALVYVNSSDWKQGRVPTPERLGREIAANNPNYTPSELTGDHRLGAIKGMPDMLRATSEMQKRRR